MNNNSPFEEAARLNKAGVAYLAANDGVKAFQFFMESLAILKQLLVAHEESAEAEDILMTEDGNVMRCSSREVPVQGDSLYIYNQALIFEAPHQGDFSFPNAIILFNMALAIHQRGKATGREALLRRALALYEYSMEVANNESIDGGALVVAALNNQTEIYYGLGDYTHAQERLEWTNDLLRADHFGSIALEDRYLDEFCLNIMTMKPPTAAACA